MDINEIELLKKKVYKDLWDVTKHALDKEEITEDEGGLIADFIIPRLDVIQSESGLFIFLNELAEKWPLYSNVYLLLKSENDNQEKMEKLKEQLHKL